MNEDWTLVGGICEEIALVGICEEWTLFSAYKFLNICINFLWCLLLLAFLLRFCQNEDNSTKKSMYYRADRVKWDLQLFKKK